MNKQPSYGLRVDALRLTRGVDERTSLSRGQRRPPDERRRQQGPQRRRRRVWGKGEEDEGGGEKEGGVDASPRRARGGLYRYEDGYAACDLAVRRALISSLHFVVAVALITGGIVLVVVIAAFFTVNIAQESSSAVVRDGGKGRPTAPQLIQQSVDPPLI